MNSAKLRSNVFGAEFGQLFCPCFFYAFSYLDKITGIPLILICCHLLFISSTFR
jgi:hypothetical protein